MAEKKHKHITLSEDAQELLTKLKDALGLTETAVIELAIRRLAKLEKVK